MKNAVAISAVILAGGKSSRMGTDKGLVIFKGKPMIEHIIESVKPLTNDLVIVSNTNNYDYLGYKVVEDIITNCGPVGGMLTGLVHAVNSKSLILSCDIPMINTGLLKFIVSGSDMAEVTIPFHENGKEPLCAVYTKSCIGEFIRSIIRGELKIQNILAGLAVRELPIDFYEFSTTVFSNINSKEELIKMEKVL